jgi:hypothetical protein
MFLKISKYLTISTLCFFWALAVFKKPYHWASQNGIFADDYRYGDLYRLSYLPAFKQETSPCISYPTSKTSKKPVILHLVGDSFSKIGGLNSRHFTADTTIIYDWALPQALVLDSAATNVLVLESVERSLGLRFSATEKALFAKNTMNKATHKATTNAVANWLAGIEKSNKGIDERLGYTLFNYWFFAKIKELKAWFTWRVLGRTNPNTVVAANGQQIFYADEADSTRSSSAFAKTSNAQIDVFVKNLNLTHDYYQQLGFDKLYLTLVPNKASILATDLGLYNHNLERVQTHKLLKFKTIDTYTALKANANSVYYRSDTHWNCQGQGIWVAKINEMLAAEQ